MNSRLEKYVYVFKKNYLKNTKIRGHKNAFFLQTVHIF